MSLLIAFVGLLFLIGGLLSLRGQRRAAADVLADLHDDELAGLATQSQKRGGSKNTSRSVLPRHFVKRISSEESTSFSEVKVPSMIGAALAALLAVIMGVGTSALFYGFVGLCIGYLFGQSRYRAKREQAIEDIERMLPVVMERLVMAAQSGLDVVAGMQSLIRIERKTAGEDGTVDIVTELLELVIQLSESGISFNQALRDVAEAIPCTALKHSFIHLAVAYEEGGELVSPLRELSDSTQLYYQEIVEERIAKLPVKATMPLVLTFAGLILFFVTTPLLQVMELLNDVQLQ